MRVHPLGALDGARLLREEFACAREAEVAEVEAHEDAGGADHRHVRVRAGAHAEERGIGERLEEVCGLGEVSAERFHARAAVCELRREHHRVDRATVLGQRPAVGVVERADRFCGRIVVAILTGSGPT